MRSVLFLSFYCWFLSIASCLASVESLANKLFVSPTGDTLIKGKRYEVVKYDLNFNPYEIGERLTNGKKNGHWIYRDQQERIVAELHYVNDTLMGHAVYNTYDNYPECVRFEGLVLFGYKTGKWVSSKQRKPHGRKKYLVEVEYDTYEGLMSKCILRSNGKPVIKIFYDRSGKEVWYKHYDKKGRMTKEDNVYPWVTVLL